MLVICPYVWHMMSSELGSASMSLLLLPLSQNESQEEGACALLTAKTPPSQEVHPCPFPVFPATLRGGFRAPEDSEAPGAPDGQGQVCRPRLAMPRPWSHLGTCVTR